MGTTSGSETTAAVPTQSMPLRPRMWTWNARQMGILGLPAFFNYTLSHWLPRAGSRVPLPRHRRGPKISIFRALAPAGYAGKLTEEIYFKFMEAVSPGMFRLIFGIYAFVPMMVWFEKYMPGRLYGRLGLGCFRFCSSGAMLGGGEIGFLCFPPFM